MFCVNCGKPYDSEHRFCNYCGRPLLDVPADRNDSESAPSHLLEPPAGSSTTTNGAQTESHQSEIASGRYTWNDKGGSTAPKKLPFQLLILQYLGLLLSSCAAVVAVTQNRALRGVSHPATPLSGLGSAAVVVFIVAASVLAAVTLRTWKKMSADRRANRVVIAGAAYLILVWALAGLFGNAVGQGRRSILAVSSGIDEYNEIGRRIGAARNVEMTSISDYIAVYRRMEPDVDEYEKAARKLEADLQEYDMRFPEHRQSTTANLSNVQGELRRALLLKKQVSVLKQIEQLDPDSQVQVWRSSMLPLFQEEDKLN